MSSVRVEADAFSDGRYDTLAKEAGLADRDHARGKIERLWWQCQQESRYVLPIQDVINVFGERGPDALVIARLGEKVEGGIRIRGTRGRIEWLAKLRKNGKKGGRPRKPKGKPSGFGESNPPAPAPAPAPTLSDPDAREARRDPDATTLAADLSRRAVALTTLLWFEHCDRHRRLFGTDSRVRPLVKTEQANGWRELRERIRVYTDLEQAESDMRHVLNVREAEAKATQSARYFGENVWSTKSVSIGLTLPVPSASNASAPEIEHKIKLLPTDEDE